MNKLVRFDWAMKHLLRNKANFDVLEGFLSELMHEPEIKIETILESESNQETEEDKFNRVDVLVKTQRGQYIIVEVQCYGQWDFLTRVLYGTSKTICEYLKKGKGYKQVVKVVSVSIVFFDLGIGKDYLYKGETTFKGIHCGDILGLNEREQKIYQPIHQRTPQTPTEIFPEYYIIKISKFHERVQDKLDEWIYFLKCGEIKTEFSAKGLKSAAQKLNVLKLSEQERHAYNRYQEALRDDASFNDTLEVEKIVSYEKGMEKGIEKGIEKGREEGIGKGIEQGVEKVAKSMKQTGLSVEEIAKYTGLSEHEINNL